MQLENIRAAKAVADIIRTCLGPRAMLKMLLNPMGSIVMTNDGNAVLREITVQHPAAKTVIEVSRTQDEEVGDGTTSVIVIAGEVMSCCQPFLEQNIHPTIIISALRLALQDMSIMLKDQIAQPIDLTDEEAVIQVIQSCLGTKIFGKFGRFACKLALDAVRTVVIEEHGRKEIDIKKYAKVEKVPGGEIEDSVVLSGVMVNKDVVHGKMSRRIENPRVVLLDSGLEYKKGESQTEVEISKEADFSKMLELEEEQVKQMCVDLIAVKPDLVVTEKGVSDLAQHYLLKANISVLRRCRRTDCLRIARATGARIVNQPDELREEDVGTQAGLFEVKKFGDEYFSFITECKNPKACSILLRGPSKDILAEIERNLQDAMFVTRNILLEPSVVPGGGAVEMAVGKLLNEKAKTLTGLKQAPYKAMAKALEVIPRTLVQNCGGDAIRTLTALRAKHAATTDLEENKFFGINGETGKVTDMRTLGIWEPLAVKMQCYKTAIEVSSVCPSLFFYCVRILLRVFERFGSNSLCDCRRRKRTAQRRESLRVENSLVYESALEVRERAEGEKGDRGVQ